MVPLQPAGNDIEKYCASLPPDPADLNRTPPPLDLRSSHVDDKVHRLGSVKIFGITPDTPHTHFADHNLPPPLQTPLSRLAALQSHCVGLKIPFYHCREVDLTAMDPLTQETFIDLYKQKAEKGFSYFLALIRDGSNRIFPVDASRLAVQIFKYGKKHNPLNRQPIDEILILALEDDAAELTNRLHLKLNPDTSELLIQENNSQAKPSLNLSLHLLFAHDPDSQAECFGDDQAIIAREYERKDSKFGQNERLAFWWYCKAAENCNILALNSLGSIFLHKQKFDSFSNRNAFLCWNKAAALSRKHPGRIPRETQCLLFDALAICYEEGIGTDRDTAKANTYRNLVNERHPHLTPTPPSPAKKPKRKSATSYS